MVLLYSLLKRNTDKCFYNFYISSYWKSNFMVNTDTLYLCTYEDVGMEILGISFVGMSIPRK